MKINTISNQENLSFESKFRSTSTLGFGVNRAIYLEDKGFFNAIKHLANDGLKREIVIGGSNSASDKFVNAAVQLRTDSIEYFERSAESQKQGLDSFQLMGDIVITLVKKLAGESGNIPQKVLEEKSTKDVLIKEGNELYKTIFVG